MSNLRKKKFKRGKHIPQRTCVGCRDVSPKRELVRLVKAEDGSVVIDKTGKLPGRGIYLHRNPACWEKGIAGEIAKGLMIDLTNQDKENLKSYIEINLAHIENSTINCKADNS